MITSSLALAFSISLVIHLFYYLFFFSRLAFRQKKLLNEKEEAPLPVSVIICARNEAENLKKLIPILEQQNHPKFEIIIVDDRSEDETRAFLLEEKQKNNRLKIINIDQTPPHINNKKYGLALAIKSASFDTLLLTDADCVPADNHWITSMTAPFTNASTKIVLGFSQHMKEPGFLNHFIRFETLYTGIQYISMALAGNPYMGVGRNLAYSKQFFLDKKGFTNHLKITGGDDDLFVNKNASKRNSQVSIGKDSMTYSIPKKTWSSYFRQKKRHLSVGKYYKLSDRLLMGGLFLSQGLFWALWFVLLILMQEPYLIIGGFVIKIAVQYLIFYRAGKNLGEGINWWLLPILDVLYVMYYIATGFSAIASRNIKWN